MKDSEILQRLKEIYEQEIADYLRWKKSGHDYMSTLQRNVINGIMLTASTLGYDFPNIKMLQDQMGGFP